MYVHESSIWDNVTGVCTLVRSVRVEAGGAFHRLPESRLLRSREGILE